MSKYKLLLSVHLSPLKYLLVQENDKRLFSLKWPLVLTLALSLLFVSKASYFSQLLEATLELLQVLVGFYIAALAAVFSLDGSKLDSLMGKDGEYTLRTQKKGDNIQEDLTIRRFLSLQLGFLSLLSIFMYFYGVALAALEQNYFVFEIIESYTDLVFPVTKSLLAAAFITMLIILLRTTTLNLYFIADKLHRPDYKTTLNKLDE